MRINLKVFRIKHGFSQDEFANKVGVSRGCYGAIERGFRNGNKKFWNNLKIEFDITEDDLRELRKVEKY